MLNQENGISGNDGNPLARGLDVLLVDDDDICLFIHERVLALSGLCRSTHSALNGLSALEMLERAAGGTLPLPDVIFLDLKMPIMDGIEFLEAFQQLELASKEQIAIVLLTSSVSEKDKTYALSLGIKHYLSKPFTIEAFCSVASSLFNQNQPLPVPAAALSTLG